jgi:lysophospholipase L1-like esterase
MKLVICEPFAIRCGAVDHRWFPEFNSYRDVARRLAHAHGAIWVPFQSIFDKAVEFAPAEHWSYDGIHPSPAGNALMAYAWLRAVGA